MSRFHSYLNSAVTILREYRGEEPLASFIKKYFAQHKKFGSKDRKQISHLCYCYFRLGHSLSSVQMTERILAGLFLCSAESNEMLAVLKPEWSDKVSRSADEKLSLLNCEADSFFSFNAALSAGINKKTFSLSHLIQPVLFIRLRPGHEKTVKQKISQAGIHFTESSHTCLALPNTSKLDDIIILNKEAIIQDYSSQQTVPFLKSAIKNQKSKIRLWDCCAASGGKSILAKDILGDIDLTVSDVRESILANLKKRFKDAGINNYKSFIADMSDPKSKIENLKSQIIIADVPCSGSGTWGRTPEQLVYFDEKKTDEYAALQKRIVNNVVKHLAPGGYLLYITCSVFKKENEDNAAFIKENLHLELIKMEVIKGYDKKADTMFVALFQKPL